MSVVTANELVEIPLAEAQRRALRRQAGHRVVFDWCATRVAACFDDAAAASMFGKRYAAFASSGEPALTTCALRSAGQSAEPVFFADPGPAYRYPARLRGAEVIAFLADAVTQHAFFDVNPRCTSFHAAAIRVGHAAAAISAISTGGKTTTAIACARRGMPIYGDERCVIIDGLVQAFPRAINIRRGGLELLASEDVPGDRGIGGRLRAHRSGEWTSAAFEDVFSDDAVPGPAPLAAIFFIEGHSTIARAERLGREQSVVRLLRASLSGPAPGLDRVAAAVALCHTTRCYALTLGTPDDTALLVAATTRRAHPLVPVEAL